VGILDISQPYGPFTGIALPLYFEGFFFEEAIITRAHVWQV
jgi:hypothetical protein